ncbi:MAG: hypothetical protein A2W90_21455 [Bacteroidetes bacterium GWF2_42_66]|nr:MAG: hypothetical protein A2W92_04270 [Bacteroidetes bacterium GWA2_42_15]OFX98901.1 MAG: hypothetical protein A2W89_13090 [Bacteroidetes bacterium GWE2_42_39]OFY45616.1 MAG: hypothetical protein A2W90_21455 [Bacteroidetes bacterium GWF2_42_66]HBL77404.1 hypothetical protein [Prolixibacteraceae bacterium]HCU62432.1 hypothetical protein [Prolixibacteraceae bacterium]
MNITSGLIVVILAGILQGSFFLPMTYTRKWEWEHNWFAFSLLAMLAVNWIIACLSIDHIFSIILQIPSGLLLAVLIFGLCWGVGAILFGRAMDLLGMALGYPVIMGINAAAGTVIPALIFSPGIFLQHKGVLILTGALITVAGIIVCTKASSLKIISDNPDKTKFSKTGLILAIIAGFTSCLPNIGAAFSKDITAIALQSGVNSVLAGNVVWSLFFTMGALVNMGYCLYLVSRKSTGKSFVNEYKIQNWLLILAMSAMWIGSFYLYGFGSTLLGSLGLVVGWPLLVSLSIVVGNVWGIYRGEWKGASAQSRRLINAGLIILIAAVVVTAMSNL